MSVCLFVCPHIFCLAVGTTVIKRNRWTVEPLNEIQFLKNKFYISILNGNLEFIDFIDYGYVQNYIFYFATIFHATLYGGMLGNFAEGSASGHTVLKVFSSLPSIIFLRRRKFANVSDVRKYNGINNGIYAALLEILYQGHRGKRLVCCCC